MIKSKTASLKTRILAAADWYVNSQVISKQPYWDANHGRFIYNRHIKSGITVLGINWTCARGIMVTLATYELTGNKKYLEAARRAGEYIKSLQLVTPWNPRINGAIAEQMPQSEMSAPRDAVEAADALLFLYRITKDKEYLIRAELWADWFLKNVKPMGWPVGYFSLYNNNHNKTYYFFEVANSMFFYHLFLATENRKYVSQIFPYLVEPFKAKNFREDGAILTLKFDAHHSGRGKDAGIAQNDDGCGITLLCDYKLKKDKKTMALCLKYGDYIISQKLPRAIHSAFPSQAIYLIELAKVSGDSKYSDYVINNLHYITDLQIIKHKAPCIQGAFKGEDEGGKWYYKGSKTLDFVTNRVTAYSALAMLKLHGKVFGPYYSSLDW
ncbi:MAG: hypothetical protein ABIA63_00575 [bacterium]